MASKTLPRSGDHFVGLHCCPNRIGGIEMKGNIKENDSINRFSNRDFIHEQSRERCLIFSDEGKR